MFKIGLGLSEWRGLFRNELRWDAWCYFSISLEYDAGGPCVYLEAHCKPSYSNRFVYIYSANHQKIG